MATISINPPADNVGDPEEFLISVPRSKELMMKISAKGFEAEPIAILEYLPDRLTLPPRSRYVTSQEADN
jgi:hypothetical protein